MKKISISILLLVVCGTALLSIKKQRQNKEEDGAVAGVSTFYSPSSSLLNDVEFPAAPPAQTATSEPSEKPEVTAETETAEPTASPTILPTAEPTPFTSVSYQNYTERAKASYSEKDYNASLNFYLKASIETNVSTNLAEAYNGAGIAAQDLGNILESEKYFLQAIKTDAQNGNSYLNLASLYWSIQDKDSALNILRNGLEAKASKADNIQQTYDVYQLLTP